MEYDDLHKTNNMFSFKKWYEVLQKEALKSEVVEIDEIMIKHYFFKDGMQQPEVVFDTPDHLSNDSDQENDIVEMPSQEIQQ